MGIYVGDSEIKGIYLGDTPVKEVYLGDTRIRPSDNDNSGLYFKAVQANSTVNLTKNGSPNSVSIETSLDGTNRSDYSFGTAITLSNIGDKVWFRNKSASKTDFSKGNLSNYYRFTMSGEIEGYGDINYLLCKTSATSLGGNYCFCGLFYNCPSLIRPPRTPATTLIDYGYYRMFEGCTGLETAPELPATSIPTYGYSRMFYSCSALKSTPLLTSATYAGGNSCSYMFYGCSNLEHGTPLRATSIASYCYKAMFRGCSKLKEVAALPSTSLKSNCYEEMYQSCTSIKLSYYTDSYYTQTYRVPPTGTASTASRALSSMFGGTSGPSAGTINANMAYYLHKDNSIIS